MGDDELRRWLPCFREEGEFWWLLAAETRVSTAFVDARLLRVGVDDESPNTVGVKRVNLRKSPSWMVK